MDARKHLTNVQVLSPTLVGDSAQFKCVQTVVGQRFAGNGPNGLSYYYYYYYYYLYIGTAILII